MFWLLWSLSRNRHYFDIICSHYFNSSLFLNKKTDCQLLLKQFQSWAMFSDGKSPHFDNVKLRSSIGRQTLVRTKIKSVQGWRRKGWADVTIIVSGHQQRYWVYRGRLRRVRDRARLNTSSFTAFYLKCLFAWLAGSIAFYPQAVVLLAYSRWSLICRDIDFVAVCTYHYYGVLSFVMELWSTKSGRVNKLNFTSFHIGVLITDKNAIIAR
jgi:hypothetical protein